MSRLAEGLNHFARPGVADNNHFVPGNAGETCTVAGKRESDDTPTRLSVFPHQLAGVGVERTNLRRPVRMASLTNDDKSSVG